MMDYVGKIVRFSNEFVESAVATDDANRYKCGTVVDQQSLNGERCLLVVDDNIFGTWKALNSNVDVISAV